MSILPSVRLLGYNRSMHEGKEPILKSLEVAGFKSFGSRKKLSFGNGITAIVGPNGSGKSNIADAVRWVLGEQRTSRLRGTKSEELIFHGTDKKAQASMAEVSLVFDNTDGLFGSGGTEVEISRQLLRSGESDYRLNGRKVNYSQVEELLAQAGIGRNSYAVIGQGTIEQLLTVSGKERKMLFDEAAGVRQFDIRRVAAKRKLELARNDLEKVSAIINELLPSQKLLQKQADIVADKQQLLAKNKDLKAHYITGRQRAYSAQIKDLQAKLTKQKCVLQDIEKHITETRKSTKPSNDQKNLHLMQKAQSTLQDLENKKRKLQDQLTLLEAEATNLQTQTSNQVVAKKTASIRSEISKQEKFIADTSKKAALHTKTIEKLEASIAELNARLQTISEKLNDTRKYLEKSQRKEFLHHANGLITTVRTQLRNTTPRPEIDATMSRLTEMLQLALQDNAAELALSMGKLQHQISNFMAEREDIIETQTQEVIKLRSVELDILAAENNLASLRAELEREIKATAKKDADKLRLQTINKTQGQITKQLVDLSKAIVTKQKILQEAQQIVHKPLAHHTFEQFEKLVNQQKNAEIDLHNIMQDIQSIEDLQYELNKQAKAWFGKQLPNITTALQSVDLSEIQHIEAELELIDQIDPSSLHESTEINQRLAFLQTQQQDLTTAITETETFISKLEIETKQRFMKNFDKINTQFQKHFSMLFGGGVARLSLSVKDELGIEISTTPPGKRTQSVAALSGGEKSLASVALLAAILACNPSPFIFLDEVDAALDDENSSRFNAILKSLAQKSQIVVISHNHETMQAATHLFGITTSGKGDSEVLHLQLQQADELVAKN
jgi:chromosome segregation ATPase